MKLLKNFIVQPKSLLLIFAVTAAIILSSVIIELEQSKSEMIELMEKQSSTLLETMLSASGNALTSYEKLQNELEQRLLNNAAMVRFLYEHNQLNNSLLKQIAEDNKIYRINIFNHRGKKVLSSHKDIHIGIPERENPLKYIQPLLDGEQDTLIIGIKPARFLPGGRFAVAVSTKNGGAIVLNVDAEELLQFRKQVGFGILLKTVTENPQIRYAALQDEKGIIAASGKVEDLESIDSSSILKKSLEENNYKWRIANIGSMEVFEAMHPLVYNGSVVGIFRLGISLEPLNKINERLTRRIIFLGIVLFVFGFVTITLVFVRQNFEMLSKRFKAMEIYSSKIIDNVSDGIIVLNPQNQILTVNASAEKLLNLPGEKLKGNELTNFFGGSNCNNILNSSLSLEEVECIIDGDEKVFLVSRSNFIDEKKNNNTILVLRDLTEQKKVEKQSQRNERLIAMGELASSVAHEIRNPLNSIGTIAQQLGKDFIPSENQNEYKTLTDVIYKEVKRINETVESFLKFSKPQPIKAESFLVNEFFEQLEKQYSSLLSQRNINLKFNLVYTGSVIWDITQMKQVFINLLENSIDALKNQGEISIQVIEKDNRNIEIKFEDTGKGISRDNLKKIFNLYFTTKTKGNGIGLSIVQKVITEHNGLISVHSEVGKGAIFTILLPKQYS